MIEMRKVAIDPEHATHERECLLLVSIAVEFEDERRDASA